MPDTSPDRFLTLPNRLPGGGGLRLHYRDWGGAGPPLILLHGLSSSARIWDLMAPLLTQHFRVLALDQRGHGLSDRPGAYSFAEVTRDLAEFIDALGAERPVIAGHSWGAGVTLQFAVAHPESPVAIALIDGGFTERSSFDGASWEQAKIMMRPPDIDGTPVERFIGFAKNWPDVAAIWSDQLQEMVLANFEVRDGNIYRPLPIPDHMNIAREIWEMQPSKLWEQVLCPVLLVSAIKEATDPQRELWARAKTQGLETARERLQNARVLVMEDTIHDIPIQRPQELAQAIIDFAAPYSNEM